MNKTKAILLTFMIILPACKIRYAMNQYTIPPSMETYSVQYFPNRAPIIETTLSQRFSDALKDKIEAQTPLRLVNGVGHGHFEGEIKDYSTRPVNITGNETAAQNRLTIKIRVKYNNEIDPKWNFDKTFSRYEDYDSNKSLDEVADQLIDEIIELILEDIFNAAFVNW